MSSVSTVVVVVGVAAVVASVAWFLLARRHPENAATHERPDRTSTADSLYDGVARPAGPDAELMTPEEIGGDLDEPDRR